jgi:hypothetical protein
MASPFLDTRLHYDYDNADFSFSARCGNRDGLLRSQFGVTRDTYSRWGEPRGTPTYYTDHPFLIKALFQQYTKIAGTEERASRTFSVGVSFAIAAGFYLVVLQTTGSFLAALAGAATLVSLPLFSVYQTCVKFETDGMLASVWIFAALTAYRREPTNRRLTLYGILCGAAFLVHWTAALFVAVLGVWLLLALRRGGRPAKSAVLVTLAAGLAGLGSLLALMSYLQKGFGAARTILTRSFTERSAAIPAKIWSIRQWSYFRANFSDVMLWALLGLSLLLASRWLWLRFSRPNAPAPEPKPAGSLAVFAGATFAVACVWQLAFPQGSFVHVYWQYWFSLPMAALVAGAIASLRSNRAALTAGTLACGILVAFLLSAARTCYAGVLKDQLGTVSDIDFLKSLREDQFDRMVFVPISEAPLNDWFRGPLFEYYTDRPVVIAAPGRVFQRGDKVLLLRYKQRAEVVAGLAGEIRNGLANEKCGQRLCAYDVVEP